VQTGTPPQTRKRSANGHAGCQRTIEALTAEVAALKRQLAARVAGPVQLPQRARVDAVELSGGRLGKATVESLPIGQYTAHGSNCACLVCRACR
jgi:hypothetical protein